MKRSRPTRFRFQRQRGQALVSYAIITAAILGLLSGTMYLFFPELMDSLNLFTHSVYFGLNLPFP